MVGDGGGDLAVKSAVRSHRVSRRAVVAELSGSSLRLCEAYSLQPGRIAVERPFALHYVSLTFVRACFGVSLFFRSISTLGKPLVASGRMEKNNNFQCRPQTLEEESVRRPLKKC